MNPATTTVHICLLGAPGSGKTRLAAELAEALAATTHAGPAFIVHEYLVPPCPGAPACTTLLMGLDLPVTAAVAALQQAADRALRDALAQAGVNYQVVYGHGEQRLRSALAALQGAGIAAGEPDSRARWIWECDNCSDPQCERRLLSDLLAKRAGAA